MIWHPLNLLSDNTQWWLFILLLLPCIVLLFRQEGLGRALRNSIAPLGILSLEMSLSPARSCQIIDSWNDEVRERAKRHVCADYWLIPVYTTVVALLAIWASQWFAMRGLSRLALFFAWAAWLPWLVGLFEFAGNSALLRMLMMHPDIPGRMSRFTGWGARLKLGLMAFAVMCGMLILMTRIG